MARELASVEVNDEKRNEWTEKFYWLLDDFKFVPGGRIMFGAGQPRRSTLLNCYFFKIREDSIEGIFDWCKEAARTYSFGGGVGTDISLLRPRGTPVNNSAIFSSGSVSFMELLSTTTGTIGQAGRRGALMITLRVDHPDIFDFINVKKDLKKVNYANISVKITDEFMNAVEKDSDFTLRFQNEKVKFEKTVRARDVWNQLVKAAWQSDEPGLIFWDTIKRDSTTEYNGMAVEGVNPCSEQTLENYGCCCLGSINLSSFVKDAFTDRASIDWSGLTMAAQHATRFLDNVLDYNADKHPLPQQKTGLPVVQEGGRRDDGARGHADQAGDEVRRRGDGRVRRQPLRAGSRTSSTTTPPTSRRRRARRPPSTLTSTWRSPSSRGSTRRSRTRSGRRGSGTLRSRRCPRSGLAPSSWGRPAGSSRSSRYTTRGGASR